MDICTYTHEPSHYWNRKLFLMPSVKRSKGSTSKLQKSQSRVKSNFLFLPSCHISFTGQICTHQRTRERETKYLCRSKPTPFAFPSRCFTELAMFLSLFLSFHLFRMVMLLSVSFFSIFFSFLFCCPLVTKCVHQMYISISLSSLYIFNNAWLEYFRLILHEMAHTRTTATTVAIRITTKNAWFPD